MKNKKPLWIALTFTVFIFTGCSSVLARRPVPDQYSFAGNGSAAAITFTGNNKIGVRLVDFEGNIVPVPPEGTVWEPAILFPAGRTLDIRVYVYWKQDRYGERRRGIFKCPPLEAGKQYKLQFSGNLNGGTLTLSSGTGLFNTDTVYKQTIPPPPK